MSHQGKVVKAPPEGSGARPRFPTHLTTRRGGRRLLVNSRFPRHPPIRFRYEDLCRVLQSIAGHPPVCWTGEAIAERRSGCQEGSNRIGGRNGGRKRRARPERRRSEKGNKRGRGAVRRSRGSNPKSQEQSPALLMPKIPPLALPHNAGRPDLPKPGRIREIPPTPIVPIR